MWKRLEQNPECDTTAILPILSSAERMLVQECRCSDYIWRYALLALARKLAKLRKITRSTKCTIIWSWWPCITGSVPDQ